MANQTPPAERAIASRGTGPILICITNASDAVKDVGDDTRDELQEQNQLAKEKKLIKIYSERKD